MPTDIFNVVELRATTKVLRERGWEYDIRALKSTIWAEDMSVEVKLKGIISEIKLDLNHYGIVFATSGEPKRKKILTEDEDARYIIKKMFELEKVVASICATVPILADIVKGKRVTCYNSHDVKFPLIAAGAILDLRSIVVDGRIVTAQAPPLAEMWAHIAVDVAEGVTSDDHQDWLSTYAYKNERLGYYHVVE